MLGERPEIRDLALIGDRRTAALIDRAGTVLWYCPGRFDRPSLLAGLLDPAAGTWHIELPGATPCGRRYLEESGVLETRLQTPHGPWTVTDWLAMGPEAPAGALCRRLNPAPGDAALVLAPRPGYAREPVSLTRSGPGVVINGSYHLYASHALVLDGDAIRCQVPAGHEGFMLLADAPLPAASTPDLDRWLEATLRAWRSLARRATDRGGFEADVAASLRAIRLLTHEESGGIIAAPTAGLPEVPGGERNYDYRYVWLRDAGMIVSALTRAGSDGTEERRFLDCVCATRGAVPGMPLPPFATLDGTATPPTEELTLSGFLGSRPVLIGNGARDQLQLDSFGNVLLAAKLIYGRFETREHWDVVAEVADYLARTWHAPDHGLWEEEAGRQYTASKVIVACGLDSLAAFAEESAQAARWRAAVSEIRTYVASNCLTSDGAYAAVAGGEAVDVSAALFPVWAYTAPDTPEMRATMAALERDHSPDGLLYRRHLECFDARREGVFLAGTFWVAQYWVMRGDLDRARQILEAGLTCANDLGLFAEEADPATGRLLGNFPQSFVHAAFIGAAIDLDAALRQRSRG